MNFVCCLPNCGSAIRITVWYTCSYLAVCSSILAQSSSLTVKTIICPNLCRGEIAYQLILDVINGRVSTNRGSIKNDTIVGVLPETDYSVRLTFSPANAPDSVYIINLPICNPVIPSAPIVSSQTLCNATPIPPLTAFTIDAATVDWYSTPSGGIPMQSATLQFLPPEEGVYYAQARFPASGCVSTTRTAASLKIKKAVCPVITIRKIRK